MQERQPRKQSHEVVLERLAALRWGGLYTGIFRSISPLQFWIELNSSAPGWRINGREIGEVIQRPMNLSPTVLAFIAKARESLIRHNVRVRMDELAGSFVLQDLTIAFAEALKFFEATSKIPIEEWGAKERTRRGQFAEISVDDIGGPWVRTKGLKALAR